MAHLMKKYISNKGAALFMVISTMTALLVSVMAMYFSMVSSKQQQFAIFNRVQASQTAQSVLDIVGAGLREAAVVKNTGSGSAAALELYNKLDALQLGEAITTNANGFLSLDPNGTGLGSDKEQLGAYAVTITFVRQDANGVKYFDIAVTTSVDGSKDVVHAELGMVNNIDCPEGFVGGLGDSEIFAATGYIPNDTYTDSGFFLTNTFFDTEYTYVGMFGSSRSILTGNLSTGGSIILDYDFNDTFTDSYQTPFKTLYRPTIWAIRGNMFNNRNSALKFVAGSKIMVGCDMTFTSGGGISTAIKDGAVDVYVLGDVHLDTSTDFSKVNLYVKGNLYCPNSNCGLNFKSLHVNGATHFYQTTVQIGDTANVVKNGEVLKPEKIEKWDDAHLAANGLNIAGVEEELGSRTQTQSYGKWVIPDGLVNKDAAVKIKLNNNNQTVDGVPALTSVFTLKYDPNVESGKVIEDKATNTVRGKGFTIDGFKGTVSNYNIHTTIIIDTGDKDDVVVPIRVKPYLDLDKDGTNETFAWCNNVDQVMDSFPILVKGRGSVIIDVEDGCVYQDVSRQQFMHYSWFKLLGGKEGNKTVNVQWEDGQWREKTSYDYDASAMNTELKGAEPVKFIHMGCKAGDGCSYTTETSTKVCEVCGGVFKTIKCAKHGNVDKYCEKCQTGKKAKLDSFAAGSGDGFCNNHIDHDTIDTFLNKTENADIKSKISDSKGVIYPNTNIYLITCSEATELRFSDTVAGGAVIHNGFYGFVYAPFITYKGKGGSMVGVTRLLGGMIVSDYVINDNYAFNACYPDRMPEDVAKLSGGGDYHGNLGANVVKSWKVQIGKYT